MTGYLKKSSSVDTGTFLKFFSLAQPHKKNDAGYSTLSLCSRTWWHALPPYWYELKKEAITQKKKKCHVHMNMIKDCDPMVITFADNILFFYKL